MISGLLRAYLRHPHRGQALVYNWLKKTNLPKTVPIIANTGLRLDAEWSDWAGLFLLRHGCIEPETSSRLLKELKPGDTFVDVGAHIGYLSLIAAQKVGLAGRVISIEPQPHNADALLRGAARNGVMNVTLYCAAAGSAAASVKLRPRADHDSSRLSLLADRSAGRSGFVVPVVTLDYVFAAENCSAISFVKLDVEGMELEVARGVDWNGEHRPRNVIAEALSQSEDERSRSAALIRFMEAQGYASHDVRGREYSFGEPLVENNIWFKDIGQRDG